MKWPLVTASRLRIGQTLFDTVSLKFQHMCSGVELSVVSRKFLLYFAFAQRVSAVTLNGMPTISLPTGPLGRP